MRDIWNRDIGHARESGGSDRLEVDVGMVSVGTLGMTTGEADLDLEAWDEYVLRPKV